MVLVLGGLLLPVVNGMRAGSTHPEGTASSQPEAKASVPPPAASEPAAGSPSNTARPVAPTSESQATVPSLQIISPKAGDTVAAPFTVRYSISGIDTATLAQLNIRMTIGNPAFYTISLPISGSQGSVTVPDDKMISGYRDLVFSLVRVDQAPVAGSPAAVVVSGITISGRR